MALAEYFSKDLLAISQALKQGTSEQFETILNQTIVGIAFDDSVEKTEGKAILDLTVRLLSRLYPKLKITDLTTNGSSLNVTDLCKSINSKIELVNDEPTVIIAIGATSLSNKIVNGRPVFYVGSDGWIARFSTKDAVGSGDSSNPFGAGVAACVGVANVFRYVFRDFINDVQFDDEFSFSVISHQFENTENYSGNESIDLGDFTLVGFGAIGNGVIWALSNMPLVKGKLTIVEPENVDITNLQRYVLAGERHSEKPKIQIAKEYLVSSGIELNPIQSSWADYLNSSNDWLEKCVLVAIDNIKDRVAIQSSLPKEIINSYTENNLIGIARHKNFGKEACLMCTYMPHEQRRSYSQEVSDNLGLPHMEDKIRNYLHYNLTADDQLIKWVAEANTIAFSELEKFKGISVSDFYSKVVCGGVLMELKKDGVNNETVEAPLAFQSALAGILLLAEKVIDIGNLRHKKLPTITHFHPLFPLKPGTNPYSHSFSKDSTGRCICSDRDFLDAYSNKWIQPLIA